MPAATAPMVYIEQLQFSAMSLISIISFSLFLIFLVIFSFSFFSRIFIFFALQSRFLCIFIIAHVMCHKKDNDKHFFNIFRKLEDFFRFLAFFSIADSDFRIILFLFRK